MIRFFDITLSLLGMILLSPLLLMLILVNIPVTGGKVFFIQQRVGKNGKDFGLIKFRTMRDGSEKKGQLTVGSADPRITSVGRIFRKYKLDELPQLVNVLAGTMSLVGPRPEVRKYVEMYSNDQQKVLSVRPGITDNASLAFIDENELLSRSGNPEQTYIRDIMPEKIRINMEFIGHPTLRNYFSILFRTIGKIF
jgi:lipopolysaccharide/colanic/teichoic acid biosynthesis glycosyltransferase